MSPLHRLAAAYGITGTFHDVTGRHHHASDETLAAMLAAMGQPMDGDAAMAEAAAVAERAAPDVLVAEAGRLTLPLARATPWQLIRDDGSRAEGRASGALDLTGLPVGTHRLALGSGAAAREITVLAPPARAPSVRELTGRARIWGLAAPVYGLIGPRDLGLGTYRDLGDLAAKAAALGADYLAINPVHALFPGDPASCSPYSPSHRRHLNTAHIDPRAVPEYRPAMEPLDLAPAAPLIDYPAHAARHRPMLEALFEAFEALAADHPRRRAFAAWRAAKGPGLERFALYHALAEWHGAYWPDWPAAMHDPDGGAVAEAATTLARRIRCHAYWQWLAEDQLSAAQRRARGRGMALGLMTDLAVGVRPDGAETWASPGLFVRDVSVGAPPDAFNAHGQDWGLAPLNPLALATGPGIAAFQEMLRANMRAAGALRIDHVLGLRRNYWVARQTGQGAYVRFPEDILLAATAIEAHRARCLVIGEDLGNVPDGLRERLDRAGIHGCRLMIFERGPDGAYAAPDAYTEAAMASIGSHDLPSLAEWWTGADLEDLVRLGLLAGEDVAPASAGRAADRARLAEMLAAAGQPVAPGPDGAEAAVVAAHAVLARTASALVTVQIENVARAGARLNVPGTVDEAPNWRRRLPPAAALAAEPLVQEIARAMRAARPGAGAAKAR